MTISRRTFLTAPGAFAAVPLLTKAQTGRASSGREAFSKEFLASLPQLMEWANVPGLAIATIKDGKPDWSRGFGVKKAGETQPATADTLFGAASLSKPVFAYAILRMRDEKLIDLDRPLWNYLSYEDLPAVENSKLITARHILSHSSGLQNWRFNRDQKLELAFKPGERFQYSGEGFYYLQRVLEHITGHGFEEYMQDRVLRPLGMVNSTFSWTKASEPLMSWGHNPRMVPVEAFNATRGRQMFTTAEQWKKPIGAWKHEDVARAFSEANKDAPIMPNLLLPNTAGSLVTSVNEYASFMTHLLERKQGPAHMADASRSEMFTTQTRINSPVSWGLGIGLENHGGQKLVWHWGDNGTFKAFMVADTTSRSGIVVFTNSQNGHRLWQRIVAEAMGRDHPAFYFWMT